MNLFSVDQLPALLAAHPLVYGRSTQHPFGIIADPTPSQQMVIRETFARCFTCEQWSPCDVRVLLETIRLAFGDGNHSEECARGPLMDPDPKDCPACLAHISLEALGESLPIPLEQAARG